jgi:DNA-binding transcriptional regulator GbsR (MarR family)
MSYTLGQAAKVTGMSKSGISRAIQKGKLSAQRQENGSYLIDPAELHRVFPTAANDTVAHGSKVHELQLRLELIETERERERVQLQERINDLARRLDMESEERRRLTALLTDQRSRPGPDTIITPPPVADATPATAPKARKWWSFGKRASA